mmetsp:Transcript_147543/g.410965  ORF Transcript_147543/g.410965 Transcript_147543/m.410965 type:complete len:155 (+) Transcript_147543:143-607(+)|eukprot:CAMPEP_0179102618 /NCGR_PEP_ID=MMETSP0796-20121207/47505_1 /TAXON_ID=73915 /ORGANISM="Pyrodinium bahamense, Strain pbaha01" /LENGTH=154 /DNA_ID=CAMNT_0020800499 /DNA_START=101 /DNA_END=565 /DNA_ORIENTATION=-
MEVPFFIAILGYFCIGCCALFFLAVLAFVLAPADATERFASWASGGQTYQADAWLTCLFTLACALAVDGLGCLSFALPGIGEGADLLWAPVSALAVRSISGGSNLFATIGFLEELLPFTDIIPTATFAWFAKYWPFLLVVMHKAVPAVRAKKTR